MINKVGCYSCANSKKKDVLSSIDGSIDVHLYKCRIGNEALPKIGVVTIIINGYKNEYNYLDKSKCKEWMIK